MKIKLLLILALLLPLSTYAEKALMTKNEFTSGFLIHLRTQIPDSNFRVVTDLRIHTKDVNGYELNIFLDNAYDVYLSGSRDVELIYTDQLDSIKSQKLALSGSDVKSILPVLKPRDYIETARKQLKSSGYDKESLPFYYEKINDDIYLMYVFDSKESMRFVSPGDVKKHGIRESISSIASKNMEIYYEKLGANLREIDTKGNGRVYLFSADENYEASILASIGYLNRAKIDSKGDLVVFIPARNIALIVDSEDADAIKLATKLAIQGYNELGYSISPYGYINTSGKWERFKP